MKILTALFVLALSINLQAQEFGFADEAISKVTLRSSVTSVKPGSSFQIVADVKNQDSFWSYYNGSGSDEVPMTFHFDAPEGVIVGPALFPKPKVKDKGHDGIAKLTFTYHKASSILFNVIVAKDFKGNSIKLDTTMDAQFCNSTGCMAPTPFKAEITR